MITASFPFLNKLTIEKNDFKDKINQFLLSWDTVAKEKEWTLWNNCPDPDVCKQSKVFTCAVEENVLSSSHRTQIVEYQTCNLIIRLTKIQ